MCRWRGTASRTGAIRARSPAAAPGWYEVKVEATRAGTSVGTAVSHVRAAPGDAEYFDATLTGRHAAAHCRRDRRPLLRGRRTSTLADDLRYTGRGVTTVEEHELWHMPIVLLLLVGLLCAEWGTAVPSAFRNLALALGLCAWQRPAPSSPRRAFAAAAGCGRRLPPRKVDYDGRLRVRAAGYQGELPRRSRRGRTITRAPTRHFKRILEDVLVHPHLSRREQHPVARRSGPVLVPGRLHVGAGLLDAERRRDHRAAHLPAEGRLHHLRRLPRGARLEQPAGTQWPT